MVAIKNILAFAGLAAAGSFNGTGQLRAQWNSGDYADLGCITDEGLYTANEDLCGSFDAKATTGSSMYTYTLTSPAGPCQIYGASLTVGCFADLAVAEFHPEYPVAAVGPIRPHGELGKEPA